MEKKELIRDKLYKRMEDEFSRFKEALEKLKPKEIIDKSYEKVYKEEILSFFYSADDFDYNQLKAINKLESPLHELYQEWLRCDSSVVEMLRDNLIDTAEQLETEMNKNQKYKDKER